jgi:hypothetical protein
MTDPSVEGKMVALPPPNNKRMKQHDEVGPPIWAAIFSPILLGLGISRFGDLENWWAYMVDLDFFIIPLDLHFDRCWKLTGYKQFMLDSVSFQFRSSYSRFCILVASGRVSSHLFYGFLSRCNIDRIDRSIVLWIGRLKILFRSCKPWRDIWILPRLLAFAQFIGVRFS